MSWFGFGGEPPLIEAPPYRRLVTPPRLLLGILFCGLVVVAATVGDYGVSWDEGAQSRYGELVLAYFASLGRDTRCNQLANLRFYGPGIELLSALLYRPWPEWAWLVRHCLSALAALATVPALFQLGRRLGSAFIGLCAGAALLLMPRFYGHAFINSKDIPFACLFSWTMVQLLDHFSAVEFAWRRAVRLGIVCGLMLCVRPAGLPLMAGMAGVLALWRWRFVARSERPARTRFALSMLVALAIAWVIMVIPWPFTHADPLLNPVRAIRAAVHFEVSYPVLFEGKVFLSSHLPRRYLAEFLLISTPPAFLFVAIIGFLAGIRQQLSDPRSPRAIATFLAQVWIVLPLALFSLQRPNVYDGIRHYLFLLPALAVWFAAGIAAIVAALPWRRWKAPAVVLAALATLSPIRSLIALHPYQMTYFNDLVGGLSGAYGRFETDYWITSYRAAIEWIGEQALRQPRRTFHVLVAGPGSAAFTVEPFGAPNVQISMAQILPQEAEIPDPFDYVIASTRYGLSEHFPESPVAYAVGRERAVFAVVRARR